MIVTYSVIIPHYGIPDLLMRCLDSIPVREDVQVIVVDDGSPGGSGYPDYYKTLARPYLTYIPATRNGGAGYARNIGMRHACGKWLLFADADDLFLPDAFRHFDSFQDSDADIIYFRTRQVMSSDLSRPSGRTKWLDELFSDKREEDFRCRHIIPSAKMIRRSFVEKEQIWFSESAFSNDLVFSVKSGCLARRIEIQDIPVYYLTEREGSLSDSKNKKDGEVECRLKEHLKAMQIIREHGYVKKNSYLAYSLWELFLNDRNACIRCLSVASECGFARFPLLFKGMILWLLNQLVLLPRKKGQ